MPEFTDENIAKMDAKTLVNSLILIFDIDDEFEKMRLQALMQVRASELKITTAFNNLLKSYEKKDSQEVVEFRAANDEIPLQRNAKGVPAETIDNLYLIMRNDKFFENIRYNLLRNAPEVCEKNEPRPWEDADIAESQRYIEKYYSIYSFRKHQDALRLLFRERGYHPIQEIVDSLKWDGVERIPHFLTKWMKAEDNEYTREVSRLIFAGGINRLYSPGCKFDDVPILIGANQGEGKSSIVRWLAVHDNHYGEATEVEGQKAIEQLDGVWICEFSELLALTKTKEQEAVKAFITRQKDKYRKPWGINPDEQPRRCIFIGTTNNQNFLKDKTGNRRFYPVKVNSNGYWLFDHEQECREYILQCWAEAKAKYDKGEMPAFADRVLAEQYKAAQDDAMQDDWRVGAIEGYLEGLSIGEYVCVRQLSHEALSVNMEFPQDPSPKDSQEISMIMDKVEGWARVGRKSIGKYGRQRCWKKTASKMVEIDDEIDFL